MEDLHSSAQLIIGIVTILFAGGLAAWVKAKASANATSTGACLKLVEAQKERVSSLEAIVMSLQDQRIEDTRLVASLQAQLDAERRERYADVNAERDARRKALENYVAALKVFQDDKAALAIKIKLLTAANAALELEVARLRDIIDRRNSGN